MNRTQHNKTLIRSILVTILAFVCYTVYSQNEPDTTKGWNLYRPVRQINQDSVDLRLKFVQDSIREQFVKDSIRHRKQVLDSLTFLQTDLQILLEAIHRIKKEEIISYSDRISIIGDSVLSDYVYHKIPLTLSDPYCPWKGTLSLTSKNIRIGINKNTGKINTIQSPVLKCSISYANQGSLIIIQEDFTLQNNSFGKFYKIPVDTVFLDRNKKIVKIKQYVQFFRQEINYRKGEFLFTNLSQVKQYQYGAGNETSQYEQVRFCDRYNAYDQLKICGIIKYIISKQDNNYLITRRNNPENEFTDGTFTLEYDENRNIKCMTFKNLTNTRSWQRFAETNKDGNVNCYIDKSDGFTQSTMCMVYHNEPGARFPVEIINTTYEKDGVSYFQKNVTTEKFRERNRLTMEWGPWR